MRRIAGLLFVFVCAAGTLQPLLAQKNAPAITRDSDHDGVMDPRDRCRATPAGTRVDATGCPATGAPAAAPTAAAPVAATTTPTPTPVTTQAAQPHPDSARPSGAAPAGAAAAAAAAAPGATAPAAQQAATPPNGASRTTTPAGASTPGGLPGAGAVAAVGAAVTPGTSPAQPAPAPAHPAAPAAAPAAAAAPMAVTDPTETAGFWLPAYAGHTDAEQFAYVKLLVIKLDSAVVALVETYRNTSGNPVAGASDPGRLTSREKARWLRCRNIGNDMHTIADAASVLKDSIAGGPTVQRSAVVLADAFVAMQALESCDVINSMVESPDRFNPWQQNYENEARNFYRDWYGQVRTVHTAARELARVLNGVLPADKRFPVPAAIPTTPPYIGAVR